MIQVGDSRYFERVLKLNCGFSFPFSKIQLVNSLPFLYQVPPARKGTPSQRAFPYSPLESVRERGNDGNSTVGPGL